MNVPDNYQVSEGSARNAQLALKLIEHGVLQPKHYLPGQPVSTFIETALKARFAEALGGLETEHLGVQVTLALQYQDEAQHQLTGGIVIERGRYMNGRKLCDRVESYHPDAGASLLEHVCLALDVLPAFTPTAAHQFLVMHHWLGDEDVAELFWMARENLAQSRNVTPESLSDEDVIAFADEHYWTPNRIEPLLPARYRNPKRLELDELAALVTGGGPQQALFEVPSDPWVLALIERLRVTQAGGEALRQHPLCRPAFELFDEELEPPFAVVIGLPHDDQLQRSAEPEALAEPLVKAFDLVEELYQGYEQQVWQSGEFGPSVSFRVDTRSDAELEAFNDLVTLLAAQLANEAKLLDLLREAIHD